MPIFYGLMALMGLIAAMAALSESEWIAAGVLGAFMVFALWRMERTRWPSA